MMLKESQKHSKTTLTVFNDDRATGKEYIDQAAYMAQISPKITECRHLGESMPVTPGVVTHISEQQLHLRELRVIKQQRCGLN
jgi:hypothetical protein